MIKVGKASFNYEVVKDMKKEDFVKTYDKLLEKFNIDQVYTEVQKQLKEIKEASKSK